MSAPLTVLLGAGASAAFGVPATGALTKLVLERTRAAERGAHGLLPHVIGITDETRSDRLFRKLREGYGHRVNFEHMLHALEAIAGLKRTWQSSTVPEYRLVEGILCSGPAGHLTECFAEYYALLATDAVYKALFDVLAPAADQALQHADWRSWAAFAQALQSEFDVLFATTNYDHLIEQAIAFSPEHEGFHGPSSPGVWRFDARQRQSIRLIHLHGNIRFGYRNPPDEGQVFGEHDHEELFWFQDPTAASDTWFGRSNATGGGGQVLHRGALITGLYKPEKLVVEPYRTYSEVFYSRLLNCPRLLVVGYGFGDPHLNYILQRMPSYHGDNRRVAYIGWHTTWPMQFQAFPDHARTIARWAGESGPMSDCTSMPAPYRPSGSNEACFRAWFGGFGDVLQGHLEELMSFLKS